MRLRVPGLLALAGILLPGCGVPQSGLDHGWGNLARAKRQSPADPSKPAGQPAEAARPPNADFVGSTEIRAADVATNRVIIYTANFVVAVGNPQAGVADVIKMTQEMGGFLQASSADSVTVRVPADKFETACARVERLGQLVSRDVNATDVSEEFVDLQMRLASNQAMLMRLKALLEKAADAKQALEVEREIGRVMTEIERLQGRIRYLESHAAMSTLTVRLTPVSDAPRPALLARRLPFYWLRTMGLNALLSY